MRKEKGGGKRGKKENKREEKKRREKMGEKEKKRMRSQVIYRAAREPVVTPCQGASGDALPAMRGQSCVSFEMRLL